MDKNILIRCDFTELLPIDALEDFQADLKKTTPAERRKLKDEIRQLGWTAPIYLWYNTQEKQKTGKILDGHQRLGASGELIAEGYVIQTDDGQCGIPVIYIRADTEQEAANILLGYNTSFAKITPDGLANYVARFDLDLKKLQQTKPLTGVNYNEVLKKMATADVDAMLQDAEPEYPIVANFQEGYNSVLIFCTNEMDWASLKEMLQLPTMKSYKNSNVGTTRVIGFSDFRNAIEPHAATPPVDSEDANTQPLPPTTD